MKDLLYLYERPFVITATPRHQQQYLSETVSISDYEREDEQRLHARLLQFALDFKLIQPAGDGVINSTESNLGSWFWLLNWSSLRSLVDRKQHVLLLNSLESEGGLPMIRVLDLHVQIGSLFDHRLLNTIANRTIRALSLIPYPVEPEEDRQTWQDVHEETPFVWLLSLLQVVIRSETKKIIS